MKKNIFLYLFIFSLLINIFTFMHFSKQEKYQTERVTNLTERVTGLKDSLAVTTDLMQRADYFSIQQNLNARNYFRGEYDIDELTIKITDAVFERNKNEEGNPLVNYPKMGEKPFIINKIKILNNRWIIADFTDGKAWGEVLLKYFIEENGEVTFENIETLIHANTLMH